MTDTASQDIAAAAVPDGLPAGVTAADIQRIVAGFPFAVRLPAPLVRVFARRRQKEFERVLRVGAPAAVLFCLLIVLVGRLGLADELAGEPGRLWGLAAAANTLVVVAVAFAFRFDVFRRRYQGVLGLAAIIIMSDAMLLSIVIESHRLAQTVTYVVMLLITIVTLALRLDIVVSAASCAFGGAAGIGIAMVSGYHPDWMMLLHYFFGALGVSLFVAWVLERQERMTFLQSVLLAHESRERERLNNELARIARQDALTGLANRRCFDERLVQEWERSLRGGHELALLFIDVDHFKRYNDSYGHSAGDGCLASVAGAIARSLCRPADLASRYGGEEFVVLLPETDVAGAREVAERIQAAVDAMQLMHAASPTAGHVTVSIGLTARVPASGLAQALVDAADSALYAAKHAGRHRIVSAGNDDEITATA